MNSRRNLLLYIVVFVLVVGAFVSIPVIIKNVNADTESASQNKVLIFSDDFVNETTFDNALWSKISDGSGNQPDIANGYLNLATQKSGVTVYNQISQKIDLKQGKIYETNINYKVAANGSKFKAEIGFMKGGPAGEIITVRSLALQNEDINFKNYFSPIVSYPGAQFFIKISADTGTLDIKNISLYEMDALPSGTSLSDKQTATTSSAVSSASAVSTISAVSTTSTVSSKTPTQTSTALATPAASVTPTALATASAKPTVSATSTDTTLNTVQSEATSITLRSGWNIVGLSSVISSADFTNKNLYVFQMLNNKWVSQKSKSKESFIINQNAGIYVYNPAASDVEVTLNLQTKATDYAAGKKWNILYNNSDSAQNISELTYKIAKSGKMEGATSYNLRDLVNGKYASNEVYILKQIEHGVALNKIDLSKNPKIPAKSAFWFYIFDLPK